MRRRRPLGRVGLFGLVGLTVLASSGCGTTRYVPQVTARGELTLRYQEGFELWAGGQRVASGLGYRGLPQYVYCVPAARTRANAAVRHGAAAMVLSALGGSFGVLSLGGLVGYSIDPQHAGPWLGSGVGVAVLGTVMAGLGRLYRNSANGHAVDAMNFYNDAVGSLGATCADLRYPPPLGPIAPVPPQLAPAPQLVPAPQLAPPPQGAAR